MSDALVRSYGATVEECFANAAIAMTAVMVDLRSISATRLTREVVVGGFDEENLLYNWLEAVLVKKDIDGEIFRSAEVSVRRTEKGFALRGILHGEAVNRHRHKFKRDVKAVTYHEMSIKKNGPRCAITFLLDL